MAEQKEDKSMKAGRVSQTDLSAFGFKTDTE